MGWFDFDVSSLFDLDLGSAAGFIDSAPIFDPGGLTEFVDVGSGFVPQISDVSDVALGGATDPSLYGVAGDMSAGGSYNFPTPDLQVPQTTYFGEPYISDVSDIALGGQTDPSLYGVAEDLSAQNQTYSSIYPDWLDPQPPQEYGGWNAPITAPTSDSPAETFSAQSASERTEQTGNLNGIKVPQWLAQLASGLGKLAIPAILSGLLGLGAKSALQQAMQSQGQNTQRTVNATVPNTATSGVLRPLTQTQMNVGHSQPRPGTMVNPELGGLPNLPGGPYAISQGLTPGRQQHYGGFAIAS